jgi:hypothetical protein
MKPFSNHDDSMSSYKDRVVITDDKGNSKTFYTFHDLIKYLDSFKMSFLPDNYTYTIHEK